MQISAMPLRARGALALLALTASLALMLAGGEDPAQAILISHGTHRFGITPLGGSAGAARLAASSSAVGYDSTGQLAPHGGPVMHSVKTHVIYWDPNGEFTEEARAV